MRKVKDLWVINTLSNPRPTLETYRYAMPGEENVPQSEVDVIDLATKTRVKMNADRFKDQTVNIATKPPRPGQTAGRGGGGGGGGIVNAQGRPVPSEWLSDSNDKLYFTRLSRDMHRLDVVLANTATGEAKTLVEERLNTYIETKPARLVNGGNEMVFWSERDGWGHLYLYDANTGALKNRITEGEYVATGIEGVDDKTTHPLHLRRRPREGGGPVLHRTSIASASTAPASSCSIPATRRTPCRCRSRRSTSSTTRRA